MRERLTFLLFSLIALGQIAFAQSNPGLYYGQVPTAAQWNSYFAAKQDVLGYTPVNKAGDTMTGKLITASPTVLGSGFNLPPGAAPSSPNNGDLWATNSGLYTQINGTTYSLTSSSSYHASRTSPVTSATLLTVNDDVVPCDSSGGNVRLTAPVNLGSASLVKRIRVEKVSNDTYFCTISSDGVTDVAYVMTPDLGNGGGWLDVELNGTTLRTFGVP